MNWTPDDVIQIVVVISFAIIAIRWLW